MKRLGVEVRLNTEVKELLFSIRGGHWRILQRERRRLPDGRVRSDGKARCVICCDRRIVLSVDGFHRGRISVRPDCQGIR